MVLERTTTISGVILLTGGGFFLFVPKKNATPFLRRRRLPFSASMLRVLARGSASIQTL